MNRKELADELAGMKGITKEEALGFVSAVFRIIKSRVKSGESVQIHDFGVFRSHSTPRCERYNPATGGRIIVAEKVSMKFKQSRSVGAELN